MDVEKNKNGQGIIEFIVIFGAILFFFIIFILSINVAREDSLKEQKNQVANDLALKVKEEISLAHSSSEGYQRNFSLPLKLLGSEYEIDLSEGNIYVYSDKIGVSYSTLESTGILVKGQNTIAKNNGGVIING